MKNLIMIGGWVIAIALGALALSQYQQLKAQTVATERLNMSLAESSAKLMAVEAQVVDVEKKMQALEVKAKVADEKTNAAVQNADPASLLKGLLSAGVDAVVGDKAEGEKKEDSKNPFAAMFEGEQGEQMMEASLQMAVDMQYGDLFNQLGLTPEKETALREALAAHQRIAMEGSMAMMRGEIKPDEIKVPSEEDLMKNVEVILSADEMQKFNDYQEALPEKMLRQQMEIQVNTFAGGLSEEARAVTVDILVENLLPGEALSQVPGSAEGMNYLESGYENALAQLDEALAPEDAARVRRFIEQQQASVQMFSHMMAKPEEGQPATPAAP